MLFLSVRRPVPSEITKWVYRQISQEVCPWNVRFAQELPPDSPLRWTSKSVRRLAAELQTAGHTVSYRLVADLLHDAGYALQANRKTREGAPHADRDAQFRYLNDQVRRFQ